MSSVTPVLNNPTLYYRPDPGEPAFRTSARASESAFVVMSQERRNLNRMKWEAFEQEREVVYANISYAWGWAGSFLAVRAGRSEVISRAAESRNAMEMLLTSAEDAAEADEIGKAGEDPEEEPGAVEEAGENAREPMGTEETAAEIERLQDEAAALERELRELEAEVEAAESPEESEAAQREAAQVEAELAEVKRKLAEKEAEERQQQLERQLEALQDTVAQALQESLGVVAKLIGMRYGDSESDVGSGLDVMG